MGWVKKMMTDHSYDDGDSIMKRTIDQVEGRTKPEDAINSKILPCNPLPFLNRMVELIKERGTDAIKNDNDVKACLWIVNAQAYGDMSNIDMSKEWVRIVKGLWQTVFREHSNKIHEGDDDNG